MDRYLLASIIELTQSNILSTSRIRWNYWLKRVRLVSKLWRDAVDQVYTSIRGTPTIDIPLNRLLQSRHRLQRISRFGSSLYTYHLSQHAIIALSDHVHWKRLVETQPLTEATIRSCLDRSAGWSSQRRRFFWQAMSTLSHSAEFILQYANQLDWSILPSSPLPEHIILDYVPVERHIDYSRLQPMSSEYMVMYPERIDWDMAMGYLSLNQMIQFFDHLTFPMLRRSSGRLNPDLIRLCLQRDPNDTAIWQWMSYLPTRKLGYIDLIIEYQDHVQMPIRLRYGIISPDWVRDHYDNLTRDQWSLICRYQRLPLKMLWEYRDKINWIEVVASGLYPSEIDKYIDLQYKAFRVFFDGSFRSLEEYINATNES